MLLPQITIDDVMIETPVQQGAKVQVYQDIPSFRNVAGRDASALKNVKLFLCKPLTTLPMHEDCYGSRGITDIVHAWKHHVYQHCGTHHIV